MESSKRKPALTSLGKSSKVDILRAAFASGKKEIPAPGRKRQMILRIVFYALIGYVVYLLIKFFQGIQKASQRVSSSSRKTGMMVKDDVCNTYLPEEDAIKEKLDGEIHYFCSEKCRDKFLESQKKTS